MHAFLEQINQTHTSQLPLEITCRLLLRTVILLSMDWQLEPFREQEVSLAVKTLERHSTGPEFESPWERISGCG